MFWSVIKNINFSSEFQCWISWKDQQFMNCCSSLQFILIKNDSKHPSEMKKLGPQHSLYHDRSFSWFGTHFHVRPKILAYHQISLNIFLLTSHPMQIKVSQAESIWFVIKDALFYKRGVHRCDMNRAKWLRQQPYAVVTAWKVFKYGVISDPYFPRIRTEYGKILHISPHSVQMRENTDQK